MSGSHSIRTQEKAVRSTCSVLMLRGARMTLLVCFMASLFAVSAYADGHEADVAMTKYRQTMMSGVGANMGAMSGIMKNSLNLPGHVANHAGQLAESAQLIAAAFRTKTTTTDTDAKAEIWTDWKSFEMAIADFEAAAKTLQTAAASDDSAAVGPAMRALGKSCGGCHKTFRKPKEESYKNK